MFAGAKALAFSLSTMVPGYRRPKGTKCSRGSIGWTKSRTTEGTGLGLSMVKAIVDLHGATISLRDNGPGLVVQIDFPDSVMEEKSPPAEVSYAGGEKGAA